MTRVIHTADTHIGYQQYHSPERRADFRRAFEQVVGDAVDLEVDAVVHAGDLFHDRRPELRDLMATVEALRRLREAGIPFLAVVGNHESTRGGQWLDLLERLGLATRLGEEPVVIGGTAFYGLDHVPASRRDGLDYEFEPHDAGTAALVAHGLFTPFAHADWETETVLAASNVGFDAMLLGDNHTPDTAEVMDTWVTYPGSTERTSASEEAARGYNLVTFEDGVDIRRRSLDTRSFVFVSVELAEDEGVERVRERVRQHDLAEAVVIVEVTGDGEPIAPAAVEELAVEEGALVARVTDRREVDSETELSVSFADPDEAVAERVDELGLSAAAREVDGTVRALADVPDSRVREEVKRVVGDRLEEGPDALGEAGDGASADRGPGDENGEPGIGDDANVPATDRDGDPTELGAGNGGENSGSDPTNGSQADGTAGADPDGDDVTVDGEGSDPSGPDRENPDASGSSTADEDGTGEAASSRTDEGDQTEGQASMEDYL